MGNNSEIQKVYPLTPMQSGILFHHLVDKESKAYFNQKIFTIKGEIRLNVLQDSINRLIKRYEVLRSIFVYEGLDEPFQVILKERETEIYFEDLSHWNWDQEKVAAYLEAFKKKDREKGFDLTGDPLIRLSLFKTGADSYQMVLSIHHILMDGWCIGLISSDLIKIYQSLLNGESAELEPIVPLTNYVKWLQQQDKKEGITFWKKYLEGCEDQTGLVKFGKVVKSFNSMEYQLEEYGFPVDETVSARLKEMARACRVTINTVFQTLWGILLQRYNNTENVVFGAVVAGRPPGIDGIEQMVGLFVNTIPVRIKSNQEETVSELLVKVQDQALSLKSYEYLSLAEIQSHTTLKSNLIDHIFVFENYPIEPKANHPGSRPKLGFQVERITSYEQTNYHFNIMIGPGQGFFVKFSYNSMVFDNHFIKNLASHFLHIIHTAVIDAGPHMRTADIEIITPLEKQELLTEFNNTQCDYPGDKTIRELFEEQVEQRPDDVALVFEHHQLTYRQFNETANQLVRVLRQKGVHPDGNPITGIMMERCLEMMIGIMAILKAGNAYLPIDFKYPKDRIQYMLDDSRMKCLLTKSEFINLVEDICEIEIINLEGNERCTRNNENLDVLHTARNLAYVIYTSGSTGIPKGVLIEHHSVANVLKALYNLYPADESDVFMLKTSYVFDVSVTELFGWFLGGSRLVILPRNGEMDPHIILDTLERYCVSQINFVPSMFYAFVDTLNSNTQNIRELDSLKYIFLAGEPILSQWVNTFRALNASVEVENIYGPTEATVYSSYYSLVHWDGICNIPIGKPIANVNLYILNIYGHSQPVGIPGELCIAGDGLARGYLNSPELTAEKFINIWELANLFPTLYSSTHQLTHSTIYRTGDLARWLADGNIEFLGRIDHQIKVRGFRIELGEIENQLLNHEDIKEAIVITRDVNKGSLFGDKYLCAYVIPRTKEKEIESVELIEYLAQKLPDYMIPNYFVQLEKIPLTPSGKVDRRALPNTEVDSSTQTYITPKGETEVKLVLLWSEILSIKKDRIGRYSSFFRLGGHSIKATILASRIHKTFNVRIPISAIFKHPTIKQMAERITYAVKKEKYIAISPVEKKEFYPLSSAQKRLYILQQMETTHTAYHINHLTRIDGSVEKEKIEKAFQELIRRHESLRTSFEAPYAEKEPIQKIHEPEHVGFRIEYYEVEAKVENFVRPFNLSWAPLMRVGLISRSRQNHILMVDIHHIITDATSIRLLIKEFMALLNGEALPALSLQYKDFAQWQNRVKTEDVFKSQEQYWLADFEGEIPFINLPYDYKRPAVQRFEGGSVSLVFKHRETKILNHLVSKENTTVFIVLLAIFNIFLSRISGQETIIVGTPIEGRRFEELRPIVGMFVNMLALKNQPEGQKTFNQFLAEVKERTLNAFENHDYQFEDLVEHLPVKRDASRNPLFDVVISHQKMEDQDITIPGLSLRPVEHKPEIRVSKFDLTLQVYETKEQLIFSFVFSRNLFKEESIKRLVNSLQMTVKAVCENPEIILSEIDVVSETEKSTLLFDFNRTETQYPKDKTIQELFENQVEKTPYHIAVVEEHIQVSYNELNQRSNQLARRLRGMGVIPDTIVGIMAYRSLEMIIGIWGVLKAGGAYLFIDPDYPDARKSYVLKDSQAHALVTQMPLLEDNKEVIKEFSGKPMVQLQDPDLLSAYSANLEIDNQPGDLAYLIYTSGSVGKPKGVMVEIQSLVNLCYWHNRHYNVYQRDHATQYAAFSFDASVWEIFPYFVIGASLHLVSDSIKLDILKLNEYFETRDITISFLPTQFCEQFMKFNNRSLRILLTGGDKLNHFIKQGYLLVNNYGPTENTVVATSFFINEFESNIPIGSPIHNVQVYILGKNLKLQPIGVSGELCVGGDSLARGYLNMPRQTDEMFTANPFMPGKRIYKTGDLVRWLPDGNLEFLGRIDLQIKIRGFRIELGEVESLLLKHPRVEAAAVTAWEDGKGDKILCAYFISDSDRDTSGLKNYLSEELPGYMVPSIFKRIDTMPLNPSGKIDRKKLPEPDLQINADYIYIPPGNQIETALARIWVEVLNIDEKNIGVTSNFFELGGHSLKATLLISKIHEALNVKVLLTEIFRYPTLQEMAELIANASESSYLAIQPAEKREYYELSSAQKRLYIQHQIETSASTKTSFNLPRVVLLESPLEKKRLKGTFSNIISRHESLRTSFPQVNGKPVQKVHDNDTVVFELEYDEVLPHYDDHEPPIKEKVIRAKIERFIRMFDLSKTLLLRVGLIKIGQDRHILMLDMHHIITDGVSMETFIKEFLLLYGGQTLPELKLQYRDFSEWQNNGMGKEKINQQEAYWLDRFAGDIPVMDIPSDYPRPSFISFEGDILYFNIGESRTLQLKNLTVDTGTTLYMVLLAICNILLSKYSRQEDIILGSPIKGRRNIELQHIIGVFVNMLAMRNHPGKNKTFREFLEQVKTNTLEAFENQDYQFDELVVKLGLQGENKRNPLFNVVFALQDVEAQKQALEAVNHMSNSHLKVSGYDYTFKIARFDMLFDAFVAKETIKMKVEYSTKLFKLSTIERVPVHFLDILDQVLEDRDIQLKEVKLQHEMVPIKSNEFQADRNDFVF